MKPRIGQQRVFMNLSAVTIHQSFGGQHSQIFWKYISSAQCIIYSELSNKKAQNNWLPSFISVTLRNVVCGSVYSYSGFCSKGLPTLTSLTSWCVSDDIYHSYSLYFQWHINVYFNSTCFRVTLRINTSNVFHDFKAVLMDESGNKPYNPVMQHRVYACATDFPLFPVHIHKLQPLITRWTLTSNTPQRAQLKKKKESSF